MTIDTDDSNTGTVFLKPVTIDLGDGDDTLTLGGTGTNTLTNSENIFAKLPVLVNLP